jgi:type I restriction enzyme S subunit
VSGEQDVVFTFDPGNLPQDWQPATIGSLLGKTGIFVDGDWVESKDQDPDGDVRLIQLADIGDGEYRNRSNRFLTPDMARKLSCTLLEPGDLLIARMPDPLGRACIFPGDKKSSVTVVDVAVVRPKNPEVNTRWLMYCVNAPQFRRAVASQQSGSTRQRISRKNLAKITFPCPPRTVQDQLVAETEKQFSRLDEAIANLKRVKANLKRYKASVLKAAVEGRLVPTEAELARKEGRAYETGEQFLARILQERRVTWEKRNANNRKKKYVDPQPPDTSGMPELSEGWAWTSVGMLLREPIVNGLSIKGSQSPPGVAALKLDAMTEAGFDYSKARFLPIAIEDVEDIVVQEGEFFISRGNGSLSLVGRGTTAQPPQFPIIFPDTMMRLRFNNMVREAEWPNTIWPGGGIRKQIERRAKTTAGIYKISQPQVESIVIPFPPSAEQQRIVAEVERCLSISAKLETQVDTDTHRAAFIRQALLAIAFSDSIS